MKPAPGLSSIQRNEHNTEQPQETKRRNPMRYFVNPRRYSVSVSNPSGGRCLLHPEFQQGPRRVIEGEYFARYTYLEEVPAEEAEAKIASGEWNLEWSHTAYLKKGRPGVLAMMPGGAGGALAAVREHLEEAEAKVDSAESALEVAEEAAFSAGETLAGCCDAVKEALKEEMSGEMFDALKKAESAAKVEEVEASRRAAQASEVLESAKSALREVMDSIGLEEEPVESPPEEDENPAPEQVAAHEESLKDTPPDEKPLVEETEPGTDSEPESPEVASNEGDEGDKSEDNSEDDEVPVETPDPVSTDDTTADDEEEEVEVLKVEDLGEFSKEEILALSGVDGRKVLFDLAKALDIPAKGKNEELAEKIITSAFG